MTGLWRTPGVGRLVIAGAVAETADWTLLVALPLFVFALTGSALVTSTVFVVQTLLTLVSAPVAGMLIDRMDVWRVMGVTAALQAVVLLPLVLVTGTSTLGIVYGVVVVQSVLGAVIEPCRPVAAAGLVPPELRAGANQLLGVGSSLARLVGAPLGGVVVAFGGSLPLVVVAAALFAASAAALVRGPRRAIDPAGAAAHPLADLRDGLRVVRRTPRLRRLLLVAALMSAAQGLFVVLFLLFVVRDLHGGEAEVGLLRGVQAIGALAAGLLLLRIVRRVPPAALASASLVVFAALSFAIWNGPLVTTEPAVYVALFILVGAPGLTVTTAMLTIVDRESPPTHRGRVTGLLFAALTAFQSVGMLAGGLVGTGAGLTIALDVQAGLYLVAGLVALGLGRGRRADGAAPAV